MRNKIGPFVGVDNRRHPSDLTVRDDRKVFDALAAAVNVDLTDDGKLRRRAGYVLRNAPVHSLWGDGGPLGYGLMGSDLVAIDERGHSTVVVSALPERVPVSFTRRADVVWWSNGLRMGAIAGDTPLEMTPALTSFPSALADASGGLDAGTYMLVFSLSGPLGEGPATEPLVVQVPESGGIELYGLVETPGFELNCYMTGANGTTFNAVQLARFQDRARIATPDDDGALCEVIGLVPLPRGTTLRSHKARLLSAKDHVLYYSEPFAPQLTRPTNYIAFEDVIRMVRPCGDGVFVATSRATYWLEGEITQASLVQVLPFGATHGSDSVSHKDPGTVYWFSPEGVVRGLENGHVHAVQRHRLAQGAARAAATYERERDGQLHVIAAIESPEETKGAVYASIGAEIIRRV